MEKLCRRAMVEDGVTGGGRGEVEQRSGVVCAVYWLEDS